MIFSSYIPEGFRYNYIVPIPKPRECYNKSLTCDDFRGIAICPIISKAFEHCILDCFGSFFDTADSQFEFKKGIGCNFAIRVVRNIVENFTSGGSTSNLCAIDLSKASDKVYHQAHNCFSSRLRYFGSHVWLRLTTCNKRICMYVCMRCLQN